MRYCFLFIAGGSLCYFCIISYPVQSVSATGVDLVALFQALFTSLFLSFRRPQARGCPYGSYGLSLCHPLRPQPSALQRSASVVLMSTRMSFRLFLPTLTSCRSHLSDFLACAITRVPTRYLLKRAHLRAFPDTPLPAPATPSSLTSTSHQLLTRTVPQICLPGPPRY